MEANKTQKFKNVVFLIFEGGFYGFILGGFLWISIYLLYILEGGKRVTKQMHIDIAPYSIDLVNLSIGLMFVSSIAALLIFLATESKKDLFSTWLKTGIVTFIGLYIFVLIKERFFATQTCCLSDSSDIILWMIILVLIVLFSVFYSISRNLLIPSLTRFATRIR